MINISVNKIYTFYICITVWILNSNVTYYCFDNRNLFFKILKKVNDRVNTTSDEILNVEKLDDIIISLLNDDFFTFINVMYILNLIVNLINIFKFYHRKWSINYLKEKLVCLYAFSSKFVAYIDINNNLFVFCTINNKVNVAIESTTKTI